MRKNQRLTPDQTDRWLVPPPNPNSFLNFQTLFGNNRPVEMEIGFGKGAFLVASAEMHPNVNFVGLEHDAKYAFLTASRLARRNLDNCKVLVVDGSKVLNLNVLAGSLHGLHLYFPDPWWKTRHHKRRIMSPTFLTSVARSLAPGMPFHMATDVPEYFLNTLKILENTRSLSLLKVWHSVQLPAENSTVTNFERKAYAQGRSVHRLLAISTVNTN